VLGSAERSDDQLRMQIVARGQEYRLQSPRHATAPSFERIGIMMRRSVISGTKRVASSVH
jgi:hypothetical protein